MAGWEGMGGESTPPVLSTAASPRPRRVLGRFKVKPREEPLPSTAPVVWGRDGSPDLELFLEEDFEEDSLASYWSRLEMCPR
jgi:hypothetical protein